MNNLYEQLPVSKRGVFKKKKKNDAVKGR